MEKDTIITHDNLYAESDTIGSINQCRKPTLLIKLL